MVGSNLVHGLNAAGIDDVVAVDDLTDGTKYRNLLGARISDYFDRDEFTQRLAAGELGRIDAIFHQGACSDTLQQDGRYMLENNYRYSKRLLDICQDQGTRLLYASSAATYGNSPEFRETPECERPLNVYGYSKLLFDNVVRRLRPQLRAQVVGLRYFNVYGPREQHKGRMASVAFHHFRQFRSEGFVKLFGEYGGYAAGEQARDFVYIEDVVAVNLWFFEHPDRNGIFNLGTGRAQTFNDVAHAVINGCRRQRGQSELSLEQQVRGGMLAYVPFPDELVGRYQCLTQADLSALRGAGCQQEFVDVATGVARYVQWLDRQGTS